MYSFQTVRRSTEPYKFATRRRQEYQPVEGLGIIGDIRLAITSVITHRLCISFPFIDVPP